MASTILYKFRSGTTFEALPLPGSAARLFDVKKAIIKTKKLDSGSMDFDLSVRNADTNEEYANEGMVLPRGTRLIVGRLPAARGHGFLARMARNEQMGGGAVMTGNIQQNQQYYTIDSRAQEEEDEEFVSGAPDEDKELAALQAVTNMQQEGPTMHGGYSGPSRGMQSHGGPGGGRGGGGPPKPSFRPNADPELREQEKKLMPKKRATGIPRTFLNLSAPPKTENDDGEGESSGPLLQPNTLGFEELVNRGGGQSENTSGTRRDLDYALKITGTTIPEHIQCGICQGVVKNAMLLPWDPEGRTTCETCIRDGLARNGFRCPLTGMDGVSPDDLLPNVGLRKAAELFVKGVMEKIDEIEKQQVEEEETKEVDTGGTEDNILDGDGVEKGVIVSKKMATSRKKSDDDDPFGGGDDDFGGDVFAVECDKPNEEAEPEAATEKSEETKDKQESAAPAVENSDTKESDKTKEDNDEANEERKSTSDPAVKSMEKDISVSTEPAQPHARNNRLQSPPKQPDTPSNQQNRRERRRGPPVGYAMGPAGGGGGGGGGKDQNSHGDRSHDHDDNSKYDGRGSHSHGGGGRGGRNHRSHSPSSSSGGRGGRGHHGFRGRGRGRGRYDRGDYDRHDGDDGSRGGDDEGSRGMKRRWEDHRGDGSHDDHSSRHERYDRDRYGGGGRGRGPPPQDDRRFGGGGGGRGGGYPPRGGFRGGGRGRPYGRGGGGYRGGGHGRGRY